MKHKKKLLLILPIFTGIIPLHSKPKVTTQNKCEYLSNHKITELNNPKAMNKELNQIIKKEKETQKNIREKKFGRRLYISCIKPATRFKFYLSEFSSSDLVELLGLNDENFYLNLKKKGLKINEFCEKNDSNINPKELKKLNIHLIKFIKTVKNNCISK